MRNVMKAATLESRFPLMAVEHGCIISKDADITVAYRVELPEVFTLTRAEYETLHSTWAKAVRVLPNYSIVHKQDIFIEESYRPDICRDDLSFLSRSFERHFNERPYLNHTCYLFLTKTTKEHSRTTSSFNALTRGFIIPKEMQDKDTVARFLECCGQFERIVNDSGLLRMVRLTDEEITGTYNPQIQISAESETKRSIFREKDKTKRSKKESAQHSKSRNKSFVMTSVSAL